MESIIISLLPEIFVLSMACLILLVEVYGGEKITELSFYMALLTLVALIPITLSVYGDVNPAKFIFYHSFVLDRFSLVLKIGIYVLSFAVFFYSKNYLMDRNIFKGEYFILGLFGVLGMMIMVSAYNLLTLYLGLELLALSLYTMVAYHRDSLPATEAAMKYFILGAIASGMLLYGMSMIYGATGSLDIGAISAAISEGKTNQLVAVFGLVFLIVGLGFKFGAVPFHMWVPDVYHGAPTPVTVYISTAPKIAAFAIMLRLLVEGLGGLQEHWAGMLTILAVLSIGIGNIIAIAQTNLKRMLAYSTISHVGFLLLGILAGDQAGFSAALFYVFAYAIMSLGGFGMILLFSKAGFEADLLQDYKGLNERNPWFAAMMALLMLSMAGVPPLLGFYAKLSVLQSVVDNGMIWLAVTAVLFSVIGAFYYLRILKLMYFDKADDPTPLHTDSQMRLAISVNGLAVLLIGIMPNQLMQVCVLALSGFGAVTR